MSALVSARLLEGDCLAVLKTLPECSIDSVVTDPPYGLQFMGKEWDKLWRNSTEADAAYVERTVGGLTSRARKLPDYSATEPRQMQSWHEEWAREVLRVLKPGGHVAAFGGTRTYHRLACAIEDAGFEIRDCIFYCYGVGFPKSHNVGKALDAKEERCTCPEPKPQERGAWPHCERCGKPIIPDGFGSALKPAVEPIVLARKPLSEKNLALNFLRWGTGAINVDGCRIAGEAPSVDRRAAARKSGNYGRLGDKTNADQGKLRANGNRQEGLANYLNGKEGDALGRWPANLCLSYPVDEYELRGDITKEQQKELFRWFHENS